MPQVLNALHDMVDALLSESESDGVMPLDWMSALVTDYKDLLIDHPEVFEDKQAAWTAHTAAHVCILRLKSALAKAQEETEE